MENFLLLTEHDLLVTNVPRYVNPNTTCFNAQQCRAPPAYFDVTAGSSVVYHKIRRTPSTAPTNTMIPTTNRTKYIQETQVQGLPFVASLESIPVILTIVCIIIVLRQFSAWLRDLTRENVEPNPGPDNHTVNSDWFQQVAIPHSKWGTDIYQALVILTTLFVNIVAPRAPIVGEAQRIIRCYLALFDMAFPWLNAIIAVLTIDAAVVFVSQVFGFAAPCSIYVGWCANLDVDNAGAVLATLATSRFDLTMLPYVFVFQSYITHLALLFPAIFTYWLAYGSTYLAICWEQHGLKGGTYKAWYDFSSLVNVIYKEVTWAVRDLLREGIEPNPGPYVYILIVLLLCSLYILTRKGIKVHHEVGLTADGFNGLTHPFTIALIIEAIRIIRAPDRVTVMLSLATIVNMGRVADVSIRLPDLDFDSVEFPDVVLTGKKANTEVDDLFVSDANLKNALSVIGAVQQLTGIKVLTPGQTNAMQLFKALVQSLTNLIFSSYPLFKTGISGYTDVHASLFIQSEHISQIVAQPPGKGKIIAVQTAVAKLTSDYDNALLKGLEIDIGLARRILDNLKTGTDFLNAANHASRVMPFAFVILSKPGAGKTALHQLLTARFCNIMGLYNGPEVACYGNVDSRGRCEGSRPYHTQIHAGDSGGNISAPGINQWHFFHTIVDTAPVTVEHSDLQHKNDFLQPVLVTASSNSFGLGDHDDDRLPYSTVIKETVDPHIIWRRSKFTCHLLVRTDHSGKKYDTTNSAVWFFNNDIEMINRVYKFTLWSDVEIEGWKHHPSIDMWSQVKSYDDLLMCFDIAIMKYNDTSSVYKSPKKECGHFLSATCSCPVGQNHDFVPVPPPVYYTTLQKISNGVREYASGFYASLPSISNDTYFSCVEKVSGYSTLLACTLATMRSGPTGKLLAEYYQTRSANPQLVVLAKCAVFLVGSASVAVAIKFVYSAYKRNKVVVTSDTQPRWIDSVIVNNDIVNYSNPNWFRPRESLTRNVQNLAGQISSRVIQIQIGGMYVTAFDLGAFLLLPKHVFEKQQMVNGCYPLLEVNCKHSKNLPSVIEADSVIKHKSKDLCVVRIGGPLVDYKRFFEQRHPPRDLLDAMVVTHNGQNVKTDLLTRATGRQWTHPLWKVDDVMFCNGGLEQGTSGSPVIAGPNMASIVGISVALNQYTGQNLVQLIYVTDIDELVAGVVVTTLPDTAYTLPPVDRLSTFNVHAINALPLGSSKHRSTFTNDMYRGRYTAIFRGVGDNLVPRKVLYGVIGGVYHSVIHDNVKHLTRSKETYCTSMIVKLARLFVGDIALLPDLQVFTNHQYTPDIDKFSEGIEFYGVRPVDRSRMGGPGFPQPKGAYLNEDGSPKQYLRDCIEQHLKDLACGNTIPVLAKAFPKAGEVGEPGKALRLVFGGDFASYAVARILLAPVIGALHCVRTLCCMVGLDTTDHKLIKERFSGFMDHKTIDIDLSKWDRRTLPEIIIEVIGGFSELILSRTCPALVPLIRPFVTSLAYPIIEYNGDFVLSVLGLPSGIFGTSELNSLMNLFHMWHGYITNDMTTVVERRKTFWTIPKATYGDDGLLGYKGDLDLVKFKASYALLNQVVTSGNKGELEAGTLADATFLKRGFVIRDGVWHMPLKLESIAAPYHWRDKPETADFYKMLVVTTALELYQHGREAYDTYMNKLRDAMPFAYIGSYDEVHGWYMGDHRKIWDYTVVNGDFMVNPMISLKSDLTLTDTIP